MAPFSRQEQDSHENVLVNINFDVGRDWIDVCLLRVDALTNSIGTKEVYTCQYEYVCMFRMMILWMENSLVKSLALTIAIYREIFAILPLASEFPSSPVACSTRTAGWIGFHHGSSRVYDMELGSSASGRQDAWEDQRAGQFMPNTGKASTMAHGLAQFTSWFLQFGHGDTWNEHDFILVMPEVDGSRHDIV